MSQLSRSLLPRLVPDRQPRPHTAARTRALPSSHDIEPHFQPYRSIRHQVHKRNTTCQVSAVIAGHSDIRRMQDVSSASSFAANKTHSRWRAAFSSLQKRTGTDKRSSSNLQLAECETAACGYSTDSAQKSSARQLEGRMISRWKASPVIPSVLAQNHATVRPAAKPKSSAPVREIVSRFEGFSTDWRKRGVGIYMMLGILSC